VAGYFFQLSITEASLVYSGAVFLQFLNKVGPDLMAESGRQVFVSDDYVDAGLESRVNGLVRLVVSSMIPSQYSTERRKTLWV